MARGTGHVGTAAARRGPPYRAAPVPRRLRERRPLRVRVPYPRPRGYAVWWRDEGRVLPGPDGKARFVRGFVLDITDQKLAEESLRRLRYYDPLTGLPNRVLLQRRLAQALADSIRPAGRWRSSSSRSTSSVRSRTRSAPTRRRRRARPRRPAG